MSLGHTQKTVKHRIEHVLQNFLWNPTGFPIHALEIHPDVAYCAVSSMCAHICARANDMGTKNEKLGLVWFG